MGGRIRENIYNLFTVLFAGAIVAAGSIVIFETTRPKDLPVNEEDGFYEIYTAYDYERFWRKAESQDFISGRLMADIYLNDLSGRESWRRTPPSKESLGPETFRGEFDGNGHTIYGLYSPQGYGLVEKNWGQIYDLAIRNSLILGYDNIGGICQWNNGTIENCIFEGELMTREEEPGEESKIAGICGENEGTLIKCGYKGTMTLKSEWLWKGIRAGICAGNRGIIEGCYNLVRLDRNTSGDFCYAIAEGGIKGCYVRRDSGWLSPEEDREQIIELDEEEAFYLPFVMKRDFSEWYSDRITFSECIRQGEEINAGLRKADRDKEKERSKERKKSAGDGSAKAAYDVAEYGLWNRPGGEGENEREQQLWAGSVRIDDSHVLTKEALADARISSFVREAFWCKGEGWRNLRLEVPSPSDDSLNEKGRTVSELRLLDTENGETVEIHAYLLEKDAVPAYRDAFEAREEVWGVDGEKLWAVCGGLLGEQGEADFSHHTWQLLEGRFKRPDGSFVLYRTEEGKRGFFYQKERMLYQVTTDDGSFETLEEMETAIRENHGLWESLLRCVWESRVPGDGFLWHEERIKRRAYAQAGFYEEEIPAMEQLMEIESLDLYNYNEMDVETLQDLQKFPGLRKLKLSAYDETELTLVQDMAPKLEELSIEGIPLKKENLEALQEFQGLKKLRLVGCGLKSLAFLEGRTELVSLILDRNEIEDISPVAGLKDLKELSLAENEIEDISPVAGLKDLKELSLAENQIRDISPMADLREIEVLRIPGNRIEDYTPLYNKDKLCILAIENNPGQEIGKAIFTPLFSGGNYHHEEQEALLEAQDFLDRFYQGKGITARELARGDLNGDGREDVAVTGLSPETEEEEGWQKRHIYVFLGQVDGSFRPIEPLETLGVYDEGGEFDDYQGMLIAEQMLVICLSGYDCDTRWDETETYRYQAGKLVEDWQMEIDWIYGGEGAVFTLYNREEGIYQDYAIARDGEGHREALLLSEEYSLQKGDGGELRRILEEGLKEIEEKAGYVLPEIYDGALEPAVTFWEEESYGYRIQSYPVRISPALALARAAEELLEDAVALPVTGYTTEEIKVNHDRLAGVELPEEFYIGWIEEAPVMLVYDSCEADGEGGYVHCFTLRKCDEEHTQWFWGGRIYFYENSGTIVIEE